MHVTENDVAKRNGITGEDDMLLACGFCDEINFFEGYWEPPVPPIEIDECDGDTMGIRWIPVATVAAESRTEATRAVIIRCVYGIMRREKVKVNVRRFPN